MEFIPIGINYRINDRSSIEALSALHRIRNDVKDGTREKYLRHSTVVRYPESTIYGGGGGYKTQHLNVILFFSYCYLST